MAVEEIRVRTRRKLEELIGVDEAAYLIDRSGELVTNQTLNQTLDLRITVVESRIEATEHRLRAEIFGLRSELKTDIAELSASLDRRLRSQTWVTAGTLFAGLTAFGALVQI